MRPDNVDTRRLGHHRTEPAAPETGDGWTSRATIVPIQHGQGAAPGPVKRATHRCSQAGGSRGRGVSTGPKGGEQSAPQTTVFFRASPQDLRVLSARLWAPPLYDGGGTAGREGMRFHEQTDRRSRLSAGWRLPDSSSPSRLLPSHHPPPRPPARPLVKWGEPVLEGYA